MKLNSVIATKLASDCFEEGSLLEKIQKVGKATEKQASRNVPEIKGMESIVSWNGVFGKP